MLVPLFYFFLPPLHSPKKNLLYMPPPPRCQYCQQIRKQASLAANFSVTQFSFLTKLLLWHGRNLYHCSAKLAQFVIHHGLIISIMQAVFSAIFYFSPIVLYQGWLMVGYVMIYAPVFLLVLDRDVNEDLALLYPKLYKELTKVVSFLFLF